MTNVVDNVKNTIEKSLGIKTVYTSRAVVLLDNITVLHIIGQSKMNV
jgi:hypothetical protein